MKVVELKYVILNLDVQINFAEPSDGFDLFIYYILIWSCHFSYWSDVIHKHIYNHPPFTKLPSLFIVLSTDCSSEIP